MDRPYWRYLILACSALLTCILFLCLALWVNAVMDLPDFYSYWVAGTLIGQGHSPYDQALWRPLVYQIPWNFEYPLFTGIFFVPWGLLPFHLAYTLWIFLACILMVAGTLVLMGSWKRPLAYVFPVIAGLLVFRPALLQVRNGQIGASLFFFLALAAYQAERSKDFSAGLLASLLLLKPNLGVPILGFWGLWFLLNKRYAGLAGMALATLGLVGGSFALQPGWAAGLLANNTQRLTDTFGFSPSLWGIAGRLCRGGPQCEMSIGGIVLVLICAVTIFLFRRKKLSPFGAAALSVSAAIACSPYGWAYDHILLAVPLLYIVRQLADSGKPFLAAALVFPTFSAFSLILFVGGLSFGTDQLGGLEPLVCFAACALLAGSRQMGELKLAVGWFSRRRFDL